MKPWQKDEKSKLVVQVNGKLRAKDIGPCWLE